jgi:hypothetical protein
VKATFVELSHFVSDWQHLRLNDDDLRELQSLIMHRPDAGKVIPGTGGMRKIRFASPSWNRGKSGSARVCYACFLKGTLVYLMAAFGKNEKENLSAADRGYYASLLKAISRDIETKARP